MRCFRLLSLWLVPGFTSGELPAERVGDWKLHLPHTFRTLRGRPGKDGRPGEYVQKKTDPALFNLRVDAGERDHVAGEHPDVVARLMQHVERAPDDLETH